ncbi:hypothetical protein AB4Z39_13645 [Mycobacterium adipatum]|uniref:hypothetical protein n=1 Tax=Mycobacteriaceae TaxID=1762 RepID=UPI000F781CCD|nr:hypothetical protein [Mycolicibacterium grossiae]
MTKAAAAAKQTGSELGSGQFGQALKRAWRPAEQLRASFEEIHQFHQGFAQTLGDAIDTSYDHYRPRFAQALTGEAGDALLASHDATVKTWGNHQDMHAAAAKAAAQALGHIKGLQGRIDNLAEAGEEEFNTAIRNRDPIAAMDVWTRYNGLAETSTSETIGKATGAIKAANFTFPLDVPMAPATENGTQTEDKGDPSERKQTDPEADAKPAEGGAGAEGDPYRKNTDPPASAANAIPSEQAQTEPANAAPGIGQQTPVSTPLTQMPQALSGAAGGGRGGGSGGGGAGSGMSGLGSALKPPSGLGSSMPTSPASSMPSAPSSSAASPMSDAGSSFQSGLASGMRAAGGDSLAGMAAPISQQSVSQQALAAHQTAGAPAFGSGPAGVPMSAPGAGAGGSSGGGGPVGGGPVSGGAPMMPPAAMGGAAPMAPYSAPGAGAGGGAPGGAGAGTAPATAGQSSTSAGSGGVSAPVVAGGAGSSASTAGLAAMGSEVSADMLLAQRVLGGLVRGSEDWPAPIAWAVGVVKTPVGSQVMVASSLGGGAYVPSTVFLPSTARLAVADPALPFGLAQRWMGCQKPSKILVDHFEQLSRRVAGAELSAMITTELWPQEPPGVTDFLGVQHRQALGMASVAPTLDGAHQHRLTALDPGLSQRVSSIDSIGGHVSAYAAAQLTAAVIQAAAQPDDTGKPLATVREGNILASVQRGTADDMSWTLYDKLVRDEYGNDHVSPDSHAPLDHDGSELTQALTMWYQHFFHLGRVIELVHLWKGSAVPPLAEIAYCGVQAGFGSVVTSMVSGIENEIRGHRGGTPS